MMKVKERMNRVVVKGKTVIKSYLVSHNKKNEVKTELNKENDEK